MGQKPVQQELDRDMSGSTSTPTPHQKVRPGKLQGLIHASPISALSSSRHHHGLGNHGSHLYWEEQFMKCWTVYRRFYIHYHT